MTEKAAIVLGLALLLASCASPSAIDPGEASAPAPAPKGAESADVSRTSRSTAPPELEVESDSPNEVDEPEESASSSDSSEGDTEAQAEDEKEGEKKEEKEKKRPERIVLDTVYDDRRVGEDQTALIEAQLGLVEDEALNEYVRSVAIRLLRHAPSRPFDYEFKIVDQSVPNAFALPGGKIYVSRGLLVLATSEDELAGVLGHEITHAAERHASAQIEYSRRMNPFTIGILRAARIAAYGRDQERDADRGGQMLAASAGYDPEGIALFLRKLDAAERYEVGWSRLPSFFATHPTSPERSALARNRATTLEWKPVPGVADDASGGYYGIIDGMIIGDDPAGGLFDDENRFIHPELRFSIRFPQGWTTMNTQQAVRALSPARDAQVTLTVAGSADDELSKVVDDFIDSEFEGMTIKVKDRREIKIGELPAIRIEGRASNGLAGLAAQMTFVRYGDLVYRLTLLSVPDAGGRYRGRGRAFAHSFRPIDEETVRSLRVTRLRIARALENETLQALSERTRNELELVFTGVLNGIYASSTLPRGALVKIGIAEPYLPRSEAKEAGKQDVEIDEEGARTPEESDVEFEDEGETPTTG